MPVASRGNYVSGTTRCSGKSCRVSAGTTKSAMCITSVGQLISDGLIMKNIIFNAADIHDADEGSILMIPAETGQAVTIPCERSAAVFCQLVSPDNLTTTGGTHNCTIEIPQITMKYSGIWRCIMGFDNSIQEHVVSLMNVTRKLPKMGHDSL